MSAVSEVHAHKRVTGLQECCDDSLICLASGMGLNVCICTIKELLCSLDGKFLYLIHELTSAVVAVSGISLRIFVCQGAAHSCHNCLADKVLGSDQLDMSILTICFAGYDCGHIGIRFSNLFK